ncbi:MAG: GNAT family N-acetyltransferase [Candidatus Binatia bacterium]
MALDMPLLETARLIIRPFALDDLEACHQLLDHEAWQTGQSLAQRRQWLEWCVRNHGALARLEQPPYGDRAVVLRATGELIGSIGLVPSLGPFDRLPSFGGDAGAARYRPEVGLFWAVRSAHRRRGYASEAARAVIAYAFAALQLGRVIATTEDANLASQAVMRRLGMTVERNPLPEPVWFQTVGVLQAPPSGTGGDST